jgi:hypothetical protein
VPCFSESVQSVPTPQGKVSQIPEGNDKRWRRYSTCQYAFQNFLYTLLTAADKLESIILDETIIPPTEKAEWTRTENVPLSMEPEVAPSSCVDCHSKYICSFMSRFLRQQFNPVVELRSGACVQRQKEDNPAFLLCVLMGDAVMPKTAGLAAT